VSIRNKTILILAVTFIAGGMLGALASGTLRRQHLNRIARLREPGGFVGFTERVLKPTPAQKDTVQKILIENHKCISELRERHMKELSVLMDSLKLRLRQVLTRDQMDRFSQFEDRMSGSRGPGGRRDFPPGPGMEPGPDRQNGLILELNHRLNLSDAQIAEIRKLLDADRKPEPFEQGPRGEAPQKRFRNMQKRMESLDAKIASLLTAEQKAEFERFRKERRDRMRPMDHEPPMPE
jgi:hypothetical protein